MVWRTTLRDLQWRLRRFLIGVAVTALVFSMSLLLAGASNGLHEQDRRMIGSFDGDAWFVASGASGPFTTTTPVLASAADDVARLPGVTEATPVLLSRSTVYDDEPHDVNVIAIPPGGLGSPSVEQGRAIRDPGDVIVDTDLGIEVGTPVSVGGLRASVVGTVSNVRFFFGAPTVYLSLSDAQRQLLGSQPFATAVVARGLPQADAPGLRRLTLSQVREDLARPTKNGDQTVQYINVLLWIVAAGIIGSILYLSALERSRDFAVMKAMGVASRSLLFGLAMQAVILSVVSAMVAAGLAQLLAPGFPFAVSIRPSTYLALLVVALVIGLLASIAGLRRALRTDPAMAFGGG